jgi:hypothetical protein
MLLSVLAILGLAVVLLALVLHAAESVAQRRLTRKRAELIRLRLQEEPNAQRTIYRKVQIRLSRS